MEQAPTATPAERQERHATWLELFYDLVFVIAISHLTTIFSSDLNLISLSHFVFLFIPIWWAWTGHTMYANRFDLDETFDRVLTLMQVLGAIFMAVFIQSALLQDSYLFSCAYLFIRAILLAMYVRAYYTAPEFRPLTVRLVVGFGLGTLIWLGSVFVPPPIRFYLWGLSWLIEFITPWTNRKKLQVAPIHNIHLPERFGLFVIIVLGESILRVTKAVSAIELWQFFTSVNAISGFILVVLIWWIYFDYIDRFITGKLEGTGLLYTYLHFFIYLGIVVLAVGIEYSILSHISTLANLANFLILTGVTLFILPLGIIQGISIQQLPARRFILSSLGLVLTMVLLFMLEYELKTFYFLPALTLILLIYLLVQRRMYTRIQEIM